MLIPLEGVFGEGQKYCNFGFCHSNHHMLYGNFSNRTFRKYTAFIGCFTLEHLQCLLLQGLVFICTKSRAAKSISERVDIVGYYLVAALIVAYIAGRNG
jgi:hypothetical protein